ncbi:hypothetical protein GUITHDRAFT_143159 [Guillardia theta CCMP2712]|uniref:Glycosyltransferase 2-like domain-containing protein n=1 Tax=Guillardia theta (strain CCMP2712) TaxID=905079 RepID=L1IUR9_GUITC|nr:hypothetical protein GUITHDRAFT_143159 [Guillardia theta CCMP2712]EKX40011.1 hypothetical protein GUITHDRAFT_143159 [Guillardia theta CCMP2712]|eukprot:XP_005826991.1 hypothetical protein GUITHDRAFT_143159 [Guillardia theta CCMP2712]
MIGGSGGECRRSEEVEVSVIIPCYNAIRWLEECLSSCLLQDFQGTMEVSIFDDSSSDGSDLFIRSWEEKFRARGIGFVANGNRWEENEDRDEEAPPGGVGRAKNKAVAQSSGKFLCFLDADDIMLPHRAPSVVRDPQWYQLRNVTIATPTTTETVAPVTPTINFVNITQSSFYPCENNTISVCFSVNVLMDKTTATDLAGETVSTYSNISITGFGGAYMLYDGVTGPTAITFLSRDSDRLILNVENLGNTTHHCVSFVVKNPELQACKNLSINASWQNLQGNNTATAKLQFRETTLLMPTWFISRETFEAVGGFEESSPTYGEAEDLIFFHKSLCLHLGLQLESLALAESSAAAAHRRALEGQREGRRVLTRVGDAGAAAREEEEEPTVRADEPVLLYRFSSDSQSWKTSRQKLLKVRVKAFEERILNGRLTRALWRTFTVSQNPQRPRPPSLPSREYWMESILFSRK